MDKGGTVEAGPGRETRVLLYSGAVGNCKRNLSSKRPPSTSMFIVT